jgi:hypothetical protein
MRTRGLSGPLVVTLLAPALLALGTGPAAAGQDRHACFAAYERVQLAMRRSHLLEAREAASVCLADTCPSALRADCGEWLKDVESRLPSIVVECTTPDGKPVTDVRLRLDGRSWKEQPDGTASDVDPGEHVLRAERTFGAPIDVRVVVAEGRKAQRVVIQIPEERDPTTKPTVGTETPPSTETPAQRTPQPVPPSTYVLVGVSALALGGFTFFAVTGKNAEHGLDSCSPHCSDDAVGSVRQRYIVADVLLGASLVALGLAAYTFFSRGYVTVPNAATRDPADRGPR